MSINKAFHCRTGSASGSGLMYSGGKFAYFSGEAKYFCGGSF